MFGRDLFDIYRVIAFSGSFFGGTVTPASELDAPSFSKTSGFVSEEATLFSNSRDQSDPGMMLS